MYDVPYVDHSALHSLSRFHWFIDSFLQHWQLNTRPGVCPSGDIPFEFYIGFIPELPEPQSTHLGFFEYLERQARSASKKKMIQVAIKKYQPQSSYITWNVLPHSNIVIGWLKNNSCIVL
jgi:hypothetical protein